MSQEDQSVRDATEVKKKYMSNWSKKKWGMVYLIRKLIAVNNLSIKG